MGLRMKNTLGVHWKIQFLGGLGKKEKGGVFEGGLIPQCTLCNSVVTL